jgi:hypothetical protein
MEAVGLHEIFENSEGVIFSVPCGGILVQLENGIEEII